MWLTAYKNFWRKTFTISGVASRAEYWWTFLINFIIAVVLQIPQNIRAFDYKQHPTARVGTGNPQLNHWLFAGGTNSVIANGFAILAAIFFLVTLLPKLTLAIRRSHDFNWPGWWLGGFWILRASTLTIGIVEFVIMAVQVNENHPTAAFNSLVVAGSTLLAYLVLMIAEMVLLARKAVRPNNFLSD